LRGRECVRDSSAHRDPGDHQGRSQYGRHSMIIMLQRRYPARRSVPFVDAELRMDPRTAFSEMQGEVPRIGNQPEWLTAAYDLLSAKRSNLQFQIGAVLHYARCPVVRTAKLADVVERVWLACQAVLPTT